MANQEATEGRDLESSGIPKRGFLSGPDITDFHTWSGLGGGLRGTNLLTELGRARPSVATSQDSP